MRKRKGDSKTSVTTMPRKHALIVLRMRGVYAKSASFVTLAQSKRPHYHIPKPARLAAILGYGPCGTVW